MPDRHPSSVHQQRQRSKIRRGQKQAVYRPWSRTILARQRSGDPIERHTARTQGAFGSEERQIVEPTAVTLAVKERHHDRGTEVHIVRLAGSLRSAPHNRVLLRAAAVRTPEHSTLDIRTVAGIPFFNEDDEVSLGIPQKVAELRDTIAAADGAILATPEQRHPACRRVYARVGFSPARRHSAAQIHGLERVGSCRAQASLLTTAFASIFIAHLRDLYRGRC